MIDDEIFYNGKLGVVFHGFILHKSIELFEHKDITYHNISL